MLDDYQSLSRLRRIAESLCIELDELSREAGGPLDEWAELFDCFTQIKDPKLRKVILDLAREYSQPG